MGTDLKRSNTERDCIPKKVRPTPVQDSQGGARAPSCKGRNFWDPEEPASRLDRRNLGYSGINEYQMELIEAYGAEDAFWSPEDHCWER